MKRSLVVLLALAVPLVSLDAGAQVRNHAHKARVDVNNTSQVFDVEFVSRSGGIGQVFNGIFDTSWDLNTLGGAETNLTIKVDWFRWGPKVSGTARPKVIVRTTTFKSAYTWTDDEQLDWSLTGSTIPCAGAQFTISRTGVVGADTLEFTFTATTF